MPGTPAQTESLCPHCLRRVPARRIVAENSVYLEKSCPEHGDPGRVLLWKNSPWAYEEWCRPRVREDTNQNPVYPKDTGCPDYCGICANHQQATCSAILEVTDRCNMRCPVCFAGSKPEGGADPKLSRIEQMLHTILSSAGSCPIQLSGGEPTLRDDLPQIVALARKAGFDHIQVNTNGIRLALDSDYGQALKDAGTTDFFLQFDGLDDSVHLRIRGTGLLGLKLKAVERCAELKLGVILVPTLVRDVNENQVGPLIQFAKKWIPIVKGVHFQPMTFLGRYPAFPRNDDRILIPEILRAIEEQTGGEVRVENMLPAG